MKASKRNLKWACGHKQHALDMHDRDTKHHRGRGLASHHDEHINVVSHNVRVYIHHNREVFLCTWDTKMHWSP